MGLSMKTPRFLPLDRYLPYVLVQEIPVAMLQSVSALIVAMNLQMSSQGPSFCLPKVQR